MTFSTSPAPPPRSGKILDRGRFAAFDDDVFDLAGAVAAEGGRLLVFLRMETGHAGFEGWEFDDDEAGEFLRPFHDLVTAAARQHPALMLGDDGGNAVGIFLVLDRIDDARTRHPVSRHAFLPMIVVAARECLKRVSAARQRASTRSTTPGASPR